MNAHVTTPTTAQLILAAPALLTALKALHLQALNSPDLRRTDWGARALEAASDAIERAGGI